MPNAAEIALDRLDELEASLDAENPHERLVRIADDQELNRLLDPLRRLSPRKLICGKCGRKLVFLALRVAGGRVFFQTHGPTPGTGEGQLDPDGRRIPPPYNQWSINPLWSGVEDPTPADPGVLPGEALRFTFTCRNQKCGATYALTNTTMLRQLVRAARDNSKEIRL
jgi:uncharacterized membrane protein